MASTDVAHPAWCDLTLCTAESGGAHGVHMSTVRRVDVPAVADLPVLEMFLHLPFWEPITQPPTIWLRVTRTDVAESVERYALAAGQLRDLAAAAGEVTRLAGRAA